MWMINNISSEYIYTVYNVVKSDSKILWNLFNSQPWCFWITIKERVHGLDLINLLYDWSDGSVSLTTAAARDLDGDTQWLDVTYSQLQLCDWLARCVSLTTVAARDFCNDQWLDISSASATWLVRFLLDNSGCTWPLYWSMIGYKLSCCSVIGQLVVSPWQQWLHVTLVMWWRGDRPPGQGLPPC